MTSPEHRAGGLRPAGARAAQRDLGDRLRLDGDRVEGAVDRRERMLAVEEDRVDADAQPAADALGRADELQPQAEVARVLHVVGGDRLDALVGHLVQMHGRVEGQAREDRHLGRGVLAVDVLGRIGLGVAELLGLGQRVVVGGAGLGHAREDEVRRPVDDPVQAVDVRRGERLLEHADDRHHARHRGLEAQLHAVLARRGPQLLAVLGQQLLVGGDNVLAGRHRAQDVVARRIEAAHDLDHEVRQAEDLVEVAPRAREHARERRPQPGDGLDLPRPRLQQLGEGRADGAVAEQADAEGVVRHARHPAPAGRRRSRGARPRARRRP